MKLLLCIAGATAIVLVASLVIAIVSWIYSKVRINYTIATQIDLQNQYDEHRYNHNIKVFSRSDRPPQGGPPHPPPRPPTPGPTKVQPNGKVVILKRPADPKGPDKK